MISLANAPIAIREQVSFSDAQKLSFYSLMQEHGIASGMILSTCNRSEVYALVDEDSSILYELVCEQMGDGVTTYIAWHKNEAAMRHAFRVCAGLTSAILGEDQIFHQMKEAYAYAQAAGMMEGRLHRLFQSIFHLTKQLKTSCRLSEQPITSSYVAWQMLCKEVEVTHKDVLLCGGGEIIQDVLPYLRECTGKIYLALRNHDQGRELQKCYPFLHLISMEDRHSYISLVDVVISATSASHMMFPYIEQKRNKPLWMLDLALPRDIDPAWSKQPLVHLYDIDQIQATLVEANKQRMSLAQEAEEFVEKHISLLQKEWESYQKQPLLALTQQRLYHMSEDTFTLLNHKLKLRPHEQRIMKKTLDYSFMRMMKQMVSVIQELDDEEQQVYHSVLKRFQEEEEA